MTRTGLFLIALFALAMAGCSSDTTHDYSSMGPMPTKPPPGSPYAPGGAMVANVPSDKFLTTLRTMSPSDRTAYLSAHGPEVGQIMGGKDAAAKQQLAQLMSQH